MKKLRKVNIFYFPAVIITRIICTYRHFGKTCGYKNKNFNFYVDLLIGELGKYLRLRYHLASRHIKVERFKCVQGLINKFPFSGVFLIWNEKKWFSGK